MPFKRILLIKTPVKSMGGTLLDPVSLGLEYIAAYIKDCVEKIDIIDLAKDQRDIGYYLKILKPDLVGISINFTIEHNTSLSIAKQAKQAGAYVVVGGYHATGLAEELAGHPYIDFVVRGEGEETMLELVQKGSAEGVMGVSYFKDGKIIHNEDRPLIKDLDSIPFPARELRKYKYRAPLFDMEYDVIMTSRGCWGKCKFCCEPMMCKGVQRYRDPKKIINEIKEILIFHGNREILIYTFDPNFFGNYNFVEEFCRELEYFKSHNNFKFKFMTTGRVDIIANNEILIKRLILAGTEIISLGIESLNKITLKSINKDMTISLQEKAINNIKNNGGKVFGFFLLGLPHQTEKDILESIDYAKKLNNDYPFFMIATPLPGSELYNELKSKNLLIEHDWDKYDYFTLVFKHDFLTQEKAEELLLKALTNIYNDSLLIHEFNDSLRNNKKTKLYSFAIKYFSIINSALEILSKKNIHNVKEYIKWLANPALIDFTKEKGLQNIFDISRFLIIIGNQKIQITTQIDKIPVISLIIVTTSKEVKYLDCIHGKINYASININIDLNDIINNKNQFNIRRNIIIDLFNNNKGIKAKLNLLRLFIALLSEYLFYRFRF